MTVASMTQDIISYMGIAFFILLVLDLMGIIYSVNARLYRYSMLYSIFFIIGIFYVMGFEAIYYELDNGERWSSTLFYERIPLAVIGITYVVALTGVIVLWISLRKRISTMLTPISLEEGLAGLPAGVCFESSDGIPLLINRKMQEIINELFETPASVGRLTDIMQGTPMEIKNGCRVWSSDIGRLISLPDGTVWDIRCREIPVKRRKRKTIVHEILAYDITKRYEKSIELEHRNEHLNAINDSLREYSSKLDSITRQREMLNAKIRLHDDVGRCLLALRAYLTDDKIARKQSFQDYGNVGSASHNIDTSEQILADNIIKDKDTVNCIKDEVNSKEYTGRYRLEELWRSTIAVLNNEAKREPDIDRMGAIRKAADAVNVSLVINGDIRTDDEEIIAAAIHECLTNTVKHADGDRLNVDVEYDEKGLTVVITNTGRPPVGEIRETGGLMNLRRIVELKGGTMEILSYPEFKLVIRR